MPRTGNARRRFPSPLLGLLLLIAGFVGAVAAYGATEPPVGWDAGERPELGDKIQQMIAERSLAVTITEAELNALVAESLYPERRLSEYAEVTGAAVSLEGDTLVARTDVAIAGAIRVPLTHRLKLEWQAPDVIATHRSTSFKDIPLPATWFPIGVVRVPLRLDERLPAEIADVQFEDGGIRLQFRLRNPFL